MSSTKTEDGQVEIGFELEGDFYRWSVSDAAKDLMLIDRFTQMPAQQFYELIEDNFDRGRGPILLAMMACSVRKAHPDWSVERITRTIMNLNLADVTFVGGDAEDVEVPNSATESEDLSDTSSGKSNGSPEQPSKKLPKTPQ